MALPTPRLEHPQSIRAVFFDAGFTMLAPHPSTLDIVARVLARRGAPPDDGALARQVPLAEAALRKRAREHPAAWGDSAAIETMWTEYFGVLLAPALEKMAEGERAACIRDVVRA